MAFYIERYHLMFFIADATASTLLAGKVITLKSTSAVCQIDSHFDKTNYDQRSNFYLATVLFRTLDLIFLCWSKFIIATLAWIDTF